MLNELSQIVTDMGYELLRWKNSGDQSGKWHGTQFKAVADSKAHDFIVERLAILSPNIPVISEEDLDSQDQNRPPKYFLIDPIDGTASYAGGFDGYVTQVALIVEGQPILAAVYAPEFAELYRAEKSKGATCNGRVLAVKRSEDRRILIDNYPQPKNSTLDLYNALNCTGYIESGSISLKICRVADGSADILFKDVAVRDWDLGAPDLVLNEAGGTLVYANGELLEYAGAFEKLGVIAASEIDSVNEAVQFYRKRINLTRSVSL